MMVRESHLYYVKPFTRCQVEGRGPAAPRRSRAIISIW